MNVKRSWGSPSKSQGEARRKTWAWEERRLAEAGTKERGRERGGVVWRRRLLGQGCRPRKGLEGRRGVEPGEGSAGPRGRRGGAGAQGGAAGAGEGGPVSVLRPRPPRVLRRVPL